MEKNSLQKRYIIVAICLIGFIITTILVCLGKTVAFDENVYQAIYHNHNELLDFFFIHYTKIGNTIPTIIICAIIIILLKREDKFLFGSTMISTVTINQLLKHIFCRPRPPLERRLVTQSGYSYPSGHTMVSLCLYGVLIYLILTKVKNKALKIALTVILTLMILLIGISRIYVGVHYPTDIIGGFFCSLAILIVDITICNHYLKGE